MNRLPYDEVFDALMRRSAAGTLSDDERARLEAHLREHPERRADLDWDQAFTEQLQHKVAALPALPGWERTARWLAAEQAEQATQNERAAQNEQTSADASRPRRTVMRAGVLDRLAEWLQASLGLALNTQAMAVALVLAQAGVIGWWAWQYEPRGQDGEHGQVRSGTPEATPRGPLLRVSFRQDLREAELRSALVEVGGEIVGGPGQLGVYLVRVQTGDLQAAAQRLRGGGKTELVEVIGAGR